MKLNLMLDAKDWHGHGSESVWIEPLADTSEEGVFRLLNTPYFARGLSWGDVVRAVPSDDGLRFEFKEVVSRSGHSTYRILVDANDLRFSEILTQLESLGSSFERIDFGARHLYALDVHPEADIYQVYATLEGGERLGVLEFEEGHVGHILRR